MKKEFDWKKFEKMPSGTKEYKEMLELTELEDEHPEGFEHACLCSLCLSYGD